ncbi:hypothetical protein OAS39_00400 [Pirellulales bacterium]|nr:hypothetical protein [Pirellulales bacterium]
MDKKATSGRTTLVQYGLYFAAFPAERISRHSAGVAQLVMRFLWLAWRSLTRAPSSETADNPVSQTGEGLQSHAGLLLRAGLLWVLGTAQTAADSTLGLEYTYNQTLGVIEWEITVTQDGTGAIAVELPFALSPADSANGFIPTLLDSGVDVTNGGQGNTWYYNESSDGSGVLVMNTQLDAANEEQNVGSNPFTGTGTEGLWIDAANLQVFAALGSDINLPVPVPVLHIASSDGVLSWTNAILTEAGSAFVDAGSATSVVLGDMNGDKNYDRNDVDVVRAALDDFAGYKATFPGLDGVARGDVIGDSTLTTADLSFVAVDFFPNLVVDGFDLTIWESSFGVDSNADANGNGVSGGADFLLWQSELGVVAASNATANAVPEPAVWRLLAIGVVVLLGRRREARPSAAHTESNLKSFRTALSLWATCPYLVPGMRRVKKQYPPCFLTPGYHDAPSHQQQISQG